MVNIVYHEDAENRLAAMFGNAGDVYFLTADINGATVSLLSDPANGIIGVSVNGGSPAVILNPDLSLAVADIVQRLERINARSSRAITGIAEQLGLILTAIATAVAAREDRLAALLEAAAAGNVTPIAYGRGTMQASIPVSFTQPPQIALPSREPVGKRIIVLDEKKKNQNEGQS